MHTRTQVPVHDFSSLVINPVHASVHGGRSHERPRAHVHVVCHHLRSRHLLLLRQRDHRLRHGASAGEGAEFEEPDVVAEVPQRARRINCIGFPDLPLCSGADGVLIHFVLVVLCVCVLPKSCSRSAQPEGYFRRPTATWVMAREHSHVVVARRAVWIEVFREVERCRELVAYYLLESCCLQCRRREQGRTSCSMYND